MTDTEAVVKKVLEGQNVTQDIVGKILSHKKKGQGMRDLEDESEE